MSVFMSASAQEENIGDLILRRTMIEWLSDAGRPLHIYVGAMPPAYVNALGAANATLYTSSKEWLAALVRAALIGQTALVFSPGQQGLILRGLEFQHAVVNVLLAGLVRLRGGQVLKLCRSLEGDSRVMLALERALAAQSTIYVSRDHVSARLIPRRPETSPDLAVGCSGPQPSYGANRRYAVMSWRHDREVDHSAVEAFITESRDGGLTPLFVTQVWKDAEQHAALASRYQVEHLSWTDRDHNAQLKRVSEVYDDCAIVFSNRLHVLILAWNSGAIPYGYSSTTDTKIWNHMDELGLGDFVRRPGDPSSFYPVGQAHVDASSAAHTRALAEVQALRRRVLISLSGLRQDAQVHAKGVPSV